MPDAPALNVQLVTRDQLARIDKGKDYGSLSGSVTLDPSVGTHVMDVKDFLTVTLPQGVPDWSFFTLVCLSGGTGVTVSGVDVWPLGEPGVQEVLVWNFQRVRGKWLGFAAGAGTVTEPDVTPPSQPQLVAGTVLDTSVTVNVTRGSDDESKPALQGRYYLAGATTKPAFTALSLSGSAWSVTGLTQNSAYVFEAQEVSRGGTSATATLQVTTAITHGWVNVDTATFTAADGTVVNTLSTTSGQSLSGSASAIVVTGGKATYPGTASAAGNVILPFASSLAKVRVSADYACPVANGINAEFKLNIRGAYPMVNGDGFKINGAGTLAFNSSSNVTWGAPVAAAGQSLTGQPASGTMTVEYDQAAQKLSCLINGTLVATTTVTSTPAALPVATGATVIISTFGGTSVTADNVTVQKYQ